MSQTELRARHGIVFAVREVAVRYLAPARLEDNLSCGRGWGRRAGARLEMAQEVWRGGDLPGAGAGDAGLPRAGGAAGADAGELREALARLPQV